MWPKMYHSLSGLLFAASQFHYHFQLLSSCKMLQWTQRLAISAYKHSWYVYTYILLHWIYMYIWTFEVVRNLAFQAHFALTCTNSLLSYNSSNVSLNSFILTRIIFHLDKLNQASPPQGSVGFATWTFGLRSTPSPARQKPSFQNWANIGIFASKISKTLRVLPKMLVRNFSQKLRGFFVALEAMGVAIFFGGGVDTFRKFLKKLLRKLRKMHYFSI